MSKSLDAVLSNEKPKEEAPKAEVVEKQEAAPTEAKPAESKPERARDESGKFAKGEKEKEEAPTPPVEAKPAKVDEPNDPESGLKAGITAERRKRQEAEKRIEALQRQLQSLQPAKQAPDVLADPNGYAQHLRSEVETALLDERVNLSVDFAKERHQDFDDVMGASLEAWTEAVAADPTLYQRAIQQRNPGEWAYQYLKREKTLSEIGDPENWKKQQLDALRKELEPTIRKELEATLPKPVVPPPSLASATSGGRVSADTAGVDRKPFDKLFGR